MTLVPLTTMLPEPMILLLLGTFMLALGNKQRRAMTQAADAETPVKD
jgi:hypothetical protein